MSSPAPAFAAQNNLAAHDDAVEARYPSGRLSNSVEDEYFTALLRGLPWPSANGADSLKTVGFTSCHGGDGVSTVAARLAARAAELGGRGVLLVDANLMKPGIERMFGLAREAGLSEVLLENCELSAAIRPTNVERLRVLSAGRQAVHPDEVHDPARMAEVVAALKEDFDLVVFDLPPAGEVVSAACLAGLLDGVVLVVAAQRTTWEVAQRVTQQLARAHARLLGAVLNKQL